MDIFARAGEYNSTIFGEFVQWFWQWLRHDPSGKSGRGWIRIMGRHQRRSIGSYYERILRWLSGWTWLDRGKGGLWLRCCRWKDGSWYWRLWSGARLIIWIPIRVWIIGIRLIGEAWIVIPFLFHPSIPAWPWWRRSSAIPSWPWWRWPAAVPSWSWRRWSAAVKTWSWWRSSSTASVPSWTIPSWSLPSTSIPAWCKSCLNPVKSGLILISTGSPLPAGWPARRRRLLTVGWCKSWSVHSSSIRTHPRPSLLQSLELRLLVEAVVVVHGIDQSIDNSETGQLGHHSDATGGGNSSAGGGRGDCKLRETRAYPDGCQKPDEPGLASTPSWRRSRHVRVFEQ